ncbi:MAG: helix-turn-helix domain-containing protein [Victivallales bacterium]|nr:helix-turn-helix domain-containing protein [Victivallales bacterium]
MKKVLCAFSEPNEYFLKHIYEYGRIHNWQIESYNGSIPNHWFGDGVITDYLTLEELSLIDNFKATSIVSRLLPPMGNVRTIRPDTVLIAKMIVEYFMAKGFSRFAMLSRDPEPEEIDGKPRHIQTAVKQILAKYGLTMSTLDFSLDLDSQNDYRKHCLALQKFFVRIERPFALILPSSNGLALSYRVLDELGFRVPEEVAVLVNNGDWVVSENAVVPTSYVGGEFRELSNKMAELLEQMMSGKTVMEQIIYTASAGIVTCRSTDTLAVSDLRLAQAVSFFLHNYMSFISVEDAAAVAGVSRGMLVRLFQNHFNKSPGRFLMEIRLNQIRHLLDSTELTLAEIAQRCGYGSDMSLSLAFRREWGCSPGVYRSHRRHMPKESKSPASPE